MTTEHGSGEPPTARRLGDSRILAFLPLFVILGWWTGETAVLFVVSFLFPLLLAMQELMRKDRAAPPAPAVAVAAGEGLAGRARMLAHLGHLLAREPETGGLTALLLLDIDGFARVNHRHGIATGDAVLGEAAARLTAAVRGSDLVACLGGDRFAVVLVPPADTRPDALPAVAERLRAALAAPMEIGGEKIALSVSAGLCLSGRTADPGPAAMLEAGEAALAAARAAGPGGLRSFTPRMRRDLRQLRERATALPAALRNGQIRPWFQPQVCSDTGAVTGFEALARWQHPDHGLLSPADFLPAADHAGLDGRLEEAILDHALSALRAWDAAGLKVPRVALNFPVSALRDPGLADRLKWAMDRFDLAPGRLAIEVTPPPDTPDDGPLAETLRALAAAGFDLVLDDFGSGPANLAALCRYGATRLKLGPALVDGIESNAARQRLIGALLRLAENLGLDVVAVGAATAEAQSLLAQMGCPAIQGYGLAAPMPFDDTIAWMNGHAARIAGSAPPFRDSA